MVMVVPQPIPRAGSCHSSVRNENQIFRWHASYSTVPASDLVHVIPLSACEGARTGSGASRNSAIVRCAFSVWLRQLSTSPRIEVSCAVASANCAWTVFSSPTAVSRLAVTACRLPSRTPAFCRTSPNCDWSPAASDRSRSAVWVPAIRGVGE